MCLTPSEDWTVCSLFSYAAWENVPLQAQIGDEYGAVFKTGEQLSDDLKETVAECEKRNRQKASNADSIRVIFLFVRCADLGYDDGRHKYTI